MIFFTADLHLGHSNIIEYCRRPFSNILEMDETLLSNINEIVKKNDTLYILGDFTLSTEVKKYRDYINCSNIHLVLGNHDRYESCILDKPFSSVSNYKELKYNKQLFVMSHYAFRVWRKSHRGSFHLYGHSHGSLPGIGRSMDVGVDCNNYYPFSIEKIIEKLGSKDIGIEDYHGKK